MDKLNEQKDVTVKIYLPSELRARFKAKCALQERSMNEVLLEFIQDFLEPPSASDLSQGEEQPVKNK